MNRTMKAIEKLINQRVIIRSDRAGVFFGTLAEIEPVGDKYTVELEDCRRLWYWDGACSITQLAIDGTTSPETCQFTLSEASIVISGVIEIHAMTDKAIKSIEQVKVWKR